MEVDILGITDKLNYFKENMFRGFRGTNSSYGNYGIYPSVYSLTNTRNEPFVGFLPNDNIRCTIDDYRNFPMISRELLRSLFLNIGVKYVPEILLLELEKVPPFEAFEKFCMTFSSNPPRVDARDINRVILKLMEMDDIRKKYPFDSRPIYSQLSILNFRETDRLLSDMNQVASYLDELEERKSPFFSEARVEFFQCWNNQRSMEEFKTQHNINF